MFECWYMNDNHGFYEISGSLEEIKKEFYEIYSYPQNNDGVLGKFSKDGVPISNKKQNYSCRDIKSFEEISNHIDELVKG